MSKLWNVGVNQAADAVVVSEGNVLLIKREDNGNWAFPGGFLDPKDRGFTETTAAREAHEEAGIVLNSYGYLIYSGKIDDPRNEEDRWVETNAYFYSVPYLEVSGRDDAVEARWFPIKEAKNVVQKIHRPIFDAFLKIMG